MKQIWNYSFAFEPASPVVEADLHLPWTEASSVISHSFQVDSGADLTGVPTTLLRDLGARAVDVLPTFDFNQQPADLPVFEVSITVAGRTFKLVKVVGIRGRIGFLGRDLLNQFLVNLDGPAGETSVS